MLSDGSVIRANGVGLDARTVSGRRSGRGRVEHDAPGARRRRARGHGNRFPLVVVVESLGETPERTTACQGAGLNSFPATAIIVGKGSDRQRGTPVTAAHNGGENLRPGVFICYRRQDSAGEALRVYTLLSAKLGEDRVFMDITIPPAEDFVEWIEKKIGAAGVVIPIIGRGWLAVDPTTGRRRIDDEKDILRNEIVGPLERGLAVLPVLVDGAQMPEEADLPSDLTRLARKELALRTDAYWSASNERLVERVTDLLGETPPPRPPPQPSQRVPWSVLATGLSGVALLVAGLVVLRDSYITPHFFFMPVAPGIFTAVAPLGVLAGTLLAVARVSWERKAEWLDVGLLAGFGFAAAAKGVSLLGESEGPTKGGGLVWVAGGVLVGTAGVATAMHLSKRSAERAYGGGTAAFVAVLGAAMLIVGAVIPFNIATPGGKRIVASDSWLAQTRSGSLSQFSLRSGCCSPADGASRPASCSHSDSVAHCSGCAISGYPWLSGWTRKVLPLHVSAG